MASASAHAVLGCGNPLLDISAPVDQAFLDKYGFQLNNAILAEDKHLPAYAEMKKMSNVEYIAGGATLNSIRVCQYCLDDKPGSTAYIGCIGDDENGKTMTECVTKDGVTPFFRIDKDTPTGTCAVAIKDSERSLCANLAAANKYEISHLDQPEVTKVYENAEVVYIAGFFVSVSPDTILKVAKYASDNGKTFCMNISAPFIVQVPPFFESFKQALEHVDILFGNESEAVAFAEAAGLEEKTPLGTAKHIAALPKSNDKPRRVIITQGAESTIVVTAGQSEPVEIPVEKIAKEKIVDLNGAGDAFVGGFISQYVSGKKIEECVNAGHKSAAYIIQRSGVSIDSNPLK